LWDYLVGGTETETTLVRNRQAIDCLAFRPRVLRDVLEIDPSGDFFGQRTRLPILLAPIGGLDSLAQDGNVRTGRAADTFGVPFMLSSVTQTGMETVAASSSAPKIFQLYTRGDEAFIDDHIARAVASGYDAFCITVDSAIYSRRERDIARRYAKPWRGKTPGMRYQAAFNWDAVKRIRDKYKTIKLLLKGIETGEHAAIACELGVDVV
jgi:isopentenyl diphosphate isomerase/L-lactate dehydrogenase-like FMN-dependent dehydrogenase